MSTPSHGGPDDPHDPDGRRPGPDDAAGGGDLDPQGPGHSGGYPDYPSYPPTPHPEDGGGRPPDPASGYGGYDESGGYTQPGAFGQDPAASQGYGSYAGYGGYQAPYDQSGYGAEPGAAEQGTGKIDVLRAVGWGFQTTFRNWKVWVMVILAFLVLALVGAIAYFAVVMAQVAAIEAGEPIAGGGAGTAIFTVVVTIISLVVWLCLIRGALHQVDTPQMGWRHFFRDVNVFPVIVQQLLVGVVLTMVMLLPMLPLLLSLTSVEQQPVSDEEAIAAVVLPMLGGILGTLLLAVLITPFTMFMPYYLVERREKFFGSIKQGVKAGGRNYGRLVLYQVVVSLVSGVLSMFTFGLVSILLAPILILITAHMYRQAAGGQIPAQV